MTAELASPVDSHLEASFAGSPLALRRSNEERSRLLARVIAAQEEDRERVAAELHDNTVQGLTAVGLRLATLRRTVESDAQRRLLDELESSVQAAIASLRRLLVELQAPELERGGLVAAFRTSLDDLAGELASTELDNGCGFGLGELNRRSAGRLGLVAIMEQAESAGGRLTIESVPGAGTTIELRLPDSLAAEIDAGQTAPDGIEATA